MQTMELKKKSSLEVLAVHCQLKTTVSSKWIWLCCNVCFILITNSSQSVLCFIMCLLVEETRYIQFLRKLNISGLCDMLDPDYWIFSQLLSLITNFQEILIYQILKLLLIKWFWISMQGNVIGPSWSSGSFLEVVYPFQGHTLGR